MKGRFRDGEVHWALADRFQMLAGRLSERELAKGHPAWLVPELVISSAAKRRLYRWAARGGFDVPRTMTLQDVYDRLNYRGDGEIHLLVADVVATLPPPVQEHVIGNSVICGVGKSTAGWCGGFPIVRRAGRNERLRWIAICGKWPVNEVKTVVAHEIAHHWIEPPATLVTFKDPDSGERLVPTRQETLAVVAMKDRIDEYVQRCARRERRAAALCRAWGFTGAAAKADQMATLASAALRTEIAAAAAAAALRDA
jgi:hypothetical protein